MTSGLLNCSGGVDAVIFIRAGCLAPAQPRGPECRRSTPVLPQQKNKITSFPLFVGGLLSLMFG